MEASYNGGVGEKRKAYEHQQQQLISSLDCRPSGNGFVRNAFTPAQWVELHRQALIYKHFISSVPVPPYLLFPIRYSNASCYMVDGRGKMVNLGFLFNNADDVEPRRCRRTDGKKWRCSKDAAPDHKYCERHMHRGKPRSRKPVEPQQNNSFQVHSSVAPPTQKKPRVMQHYNNALNLNYSSLEDYSYPILNSEEEPQTETRSFIDAWSIQNQKPVPEMESGNGFDSLGLLSNSDLSLSMSNEQIALGLTDRLSSMQSPVNWGTEGSSLDGPLGEFFQRHQQVMKTVIEDLNAPELINLWSENYQISPHGSPIRNVVSSPSGVLQKTLFSQSDSSNVSSPTFGAFNWHR